MKFNVTWLQEKTMEIDVADIKEAEAWGRALIGRLLSGNPNHIDGWHDIQGYAKLIEQRLNKRSK